MTTAPRKSLEPFLRDSVQYYEHQVTGVRQMARMPSVLLADDMGLGKSLQALTLYCIDLKLGKDGKCIIVCPVTLRENWAEEIDKFTRIPYTLLGQEAHPTKLNQLKNLTPAKRELQLVEFLKQPGPAILICNYEQLTNAVHAATLRTARFHMAIFDEAHMIKNPKSKRTQASLALRSARSLMLTGTPMLNKVDELWPLLHRINPQEFPKYWTFVNRYCVFGGYENRQIIATKNEADLKKILGRYMIRRLKKNVLNRAEPTYIMHKVGLSEVQRKLYDQIEDEIFLINPETGEAMDVENPLTKFLRLKQICNTPYSINPAFEDDSRKLDRAVEITDEIVTRGDKVIVFTQFRGTMAAMVNRYGKAKLGPVFQIHGDVPTGNRQGVVRDWGNVQGGAILLCQTEVAGVGLNMTAASEIIRIDRLFVPGLNKQAVDRADRIGQTSPVVVHDLVTKGTVEGRVEAIVNSKEGLGEEIIGGAMGIAKLMQKLREMEKE
jgi:SNF2 family DNA or RNA helicase